MHYKKDSKIGDSKTEKSPHSIEYGKKNKYKKTYYEQQLFKISRPRIPI